RDRAAGDGFVGEGLDVVGDNDALADVGAGPHRLRDGPGGEAERLDRVGGIGRTAGNIQILVGAGVHGDFTGRSGRGDAGRSAGDRRNLGQQRSHIVGDVEL